MRELISWIDNHLLKIGASLIIVVAVLYPKFPVIDIPNTWVYVRFEDFLIALVLGFWLIQFLRKKVDLKTPLTRPIFAFLLAGGVSTLWAIVFPDPKVDFFPHLAVLHWARRIEYLAVFFLVYTTIKTWSDFWDYLGIYLVSTWLVILYGIGQRYYNLPAFSTMNEEFAKGIPLYLQEHSRVLSTFAGHYDFAAYLVLVIALFGSLYFGVGKKIKYLYLLTVVSGFYLLLLTFSRVSFGAYMVAVVFVVLLQRINWPRKALMLFLVVFLSVLSVSKTAEFSDRFGKMIAFDESWIKSLPFFAEKLPTATSSGDLMPLSDIVPKPRVTTESGGVVSKETKKKKLVAVPTRRPRPPKKEKKETEEKKEEKKTIYLDRSTSTRLEVEWPRAMRAFLKNPILGSGYSTITLATDNDYLRLLGETGLAGFLTFMWIFVSLAVFLKKQTEKKIKNIFHWEIVVAIISVCLGMLANALLIDVFEASKVAISFWGILALLLAYFKIKRLRKTKVYN